MRNRPRCTMFRFRREVLLLIGMGFGQAIFGQSPVPPPPPVTSGEQIPAPGRPVPADHSQLSEHNVEWLQTQPAQVQAEFLLGAAINHDHGATSMIEKMVDDWHGKLHYTQK